jgi:ABC-type sugar transport system ATPase subunit
LELKGVSKSFGAVQALYEVDFHVSRGEVMALVGDNGAGKSTLIKCIAGIYSIDSGGVFFEGERVSIHGPKDSANLGIEVVYQDLALADNLDVVQNMFLGREELTGPLRSLDEITMERRANETLATLSVTTIRSVRQTVAGLSGGQRQSVAVAKAVMWNSKVVILDEPTAALGVAQDPSGARPRQAPRRAGPRGRAHLAQPVRRLRGGRHHHGPAPRSERRRVQAQGRHPRRRWWRRSPPASSPRCPVCRKR